MRLTLYPGERLVPLADASALHSSMRIFNLVFEAEAFLYKLIRRITGTLVHISKGQMTEQDVLDRFACPPDHYDSPLPTTLKPHGLFLNQVKYNESDFLCPPVLRTIGDDLDDVVNEVQEEDDDDDEGEPPTTERMVAR